ncbi:hypothetical protein [Xanthomonas phaseoli]|nr:hypothetical protein [Xanthomonas phaseoli]MBO9790340.1 hypothetical protein [Xanthomonas phaseoli pv. dieffenbachiae]MBO9887880.1 hypothetical protein [Xanthomonas phaseoli pv. dieffenbachiae]MBO9916642.1 hypothetical protein [Xanthomonas phaseoli pv. dieffenbachiae]MBO9940922.1 hypothetical protein [Xanthomonas phaseoli pv. dieffenbachiae]MBO9996987.1 hypothetical protein [Xanthomonas phaseoli pv. dieffenbachiae]
MTLVLRRTSPTFMVFMASEFLFMHAHPAGSGLRWYSKNERDEALRGIAATSRLFGRLLLVGGSICWAKPVSHVFGKTEWRVRNQVPVCYGGKLISLYGKRLEGARSIQGMHSAFTRSGEERLTRICTSAAKMTSPEIASTGSCKLREIFGITASD